MLKLSEGLRKLAQGTALAAVVGLGSLALAAAPADAQRGGGMHGGGMGGFHGGGMGGFHGGGFHGGMGGFHGGGFHGGAWHGGWGWRGGWRGGRWWGPGWGGWRGGWWHNHWYGPGWAGWWGVAATWPAWGWGYPYYSGYAYPSCTYYDYYYGYCSGGYGGYGY